MDTDKAKIPAISILGFFDKSNLASEVFSGSASANAMAALESNCVFDRFKLVNEEFRAKAAFRAKI